MTKPDEIILPLDVVAAWSVSPKADLPGIILILRHLPLDQVSAGAALTQTAVILTPDQARLLSADLARNAALFPEGPSGPTN